MRIYAGHNIDGDDHPFYRVSYFIFGARTFDYLGILYLNKRGGHWFSVHGCSQSGDRLPAVRR